MRPQFAQMIFYRRAGGTQAMPGFDVAHNPGGAAAGVLHRLRLIQNQQVPAGLSERVVVAPQQRIGGERNVVLLNLSKALGFVLPVEDVRGRQRHQRGAIEPPGFLFRQQMRQRLRGFAQPHVVGQDAGQILFAQVLQPGQAVALVGVQFQTQSLGRLDGLDATLVLQLAGELDHGFAACALPLLVVRDAGQAWRVQPACVALKQAV